MQYIRFHHILLSALLLSFALPGMTQNWYGFSMNGVCFASPSAHDLTGDGVADVVLGAGTEAVPTDYAIVALNGLNGNLLWSKRCRSQIYTQPLYHDLNGDAHPDVVIGGREAQLYALNGLTGNVIWEFFPDSLGSCFDSAWYNFYSPQWIDDQNQDGLPELLISNGGYPPAQPNDSLRPPGYLMVIDGATGAVLAKDTMPDGQEIYYSPQAVNRLPDGKTDVFFGSGGETTHGKFWHIPLDSLMAGHLQSAEPLLTGPAKGYIAVASWAHLNADLVQDVIVPDMNGRFVALDGATLQPLWEVVRPGTEAYVSPAIGHFNADGIADAFLSFAVGVYPFYGSYRHLWVDGATGAVLHELTTSLYQLCAPSLADWDNDGTDDLIWMHNSDLGTTTINYHTRLECWRWQDNTLDTIALDSLLPGLNPYSQVLLTDIDNDQLLDIIYIRNLSKNSWYAAGGYGVHRREFAVSPDLVAWAGYLGPDGGGVYTFSDASLPAAGAAWLYPNPATTFAQPSGEAAVTSGELLDAAGRVCARLTNGLFEVALLPPGIYAYRIWQQDGQLLTGKLNITH